MDETEEYISEYIIQNSGYLNGFNQISTRIPINSTRHFYS